MTSITPVHSESVSVSTEANKRIELIDMLRGFALVGILLLHHMGHFNMFVPPGQPIGPFSPEFDKEVARLMRLIFLGKAYCLFSFLFGYSFWIQFRNQQSRGYDFGPRFAWRMVLLFFLGNIHMIYYRGDILAFYAMLSFPLILTRKWPTWIVFSVAALLISNPYFTARLIYHLHNPDVALVKHTFGNFFPEIKKLMINGPFWELSWVNLTKGRISILEWNWYQGRVFQTAALFLFGMVAARVNLFSKTSAKTWFVVFIVSFLILLPLHFVLANYGLWSEPGKFRNLTRGLLGPNRSLIQMIMMTSLLCLAWNVRPLRNALQVLVPFGKMSLTNYMLMGLIGVFLYQGVGLGLYRYLGSTLSLLVALILTVLHIIGSTLWLKRFKQGPLEYLWKKLTWISLNKKT